MHDAVNLEGRGIPSVFVATVEFTDGAHAQARALGADPAAIFIEHPIQDRTDEELRELADRALEPILDALIASGS